MLHATTDLLRHELGVVLSTTILRLVVAAILGGLIGLERQLRRKPAGLRTNLFICFGSAMFTVLSDQLAGNLGGDHTRIAAQIIPGIGFIGAGAILHQRGSVTGLTTAATLFVVASVGMAAGGGLYVTAVFATVVILVSLAALGAMETRYGLKSVDRAYEVTGATAEVLLAELNRVLETETLRMRDVRAITAHGQTRVVFTVDGGEPEHEHLNVRLHESSVFARVEALGVAERE